MAAAEVASRAHEQLPEAGGSSGASDTPHVIAQSHITPLPATADSINVKAAPTIDPASKYPDLPPAHAALLASLPLSPPPLPPPPPPPPPSFDPASIEYVTYTSEYQLPYIQSLIDRDLSEPYSIYTYRYFINNWPHLTLLALIHVPNNADAAKPAITAATGDETDATIASHNDATSTTYCVGTIICKLSPPAQPMSPSSLSRGYLAMLATHHHYRHLGIARHLVNTALATMQQQHADVVVLETETTNAAALSLYAALHFTRDCRLPRYYLNGGDAYRLKRWLTGRAERVARAERERKRMEETMSAASADGDEGATSVVGAGAMHQLAEQAERMSVEEDLYGQQQEESDEEV